MNYKIKRIINNTDENIKRKKLSFNQDWRFFRGDFTEADAINVDFDDSAWEIVYLPHTVRIEPANCSGGHNYLGIAWYRRHFFVDKSYIGKKLYVELEGAKHVADIWINGIHLATHYGGYLPFTVDITEYVNYAEEADNVIVVKANNSDMPDIPPGIPQGRLDFCYYGGIYRDVWLHITDKLHITDAVYANKKAGGGIFVTYPEVNAKEAKVQIKTHVINENNISKNTSVTNYMVDTDKVVVSYNTTSVCIINGQESNTFTQTLTLSKPKLWHPDHPYQYTVYTMVSDGNILVDIFETRIGIRTIKFDADGFEINGESLKLIGANRHQEYVYIGDAVPDSMHRRDAIKLKEGGFNIIRTGHYPQATAFMDACDDLGLMCIVPTPGWHWFNNNNKFLERAYQNVREMVRWHRNHPSVVLWEPILNEADYSEEYASFVYDITHEEYLGGQCFAACDSDRVCSSKYDVIYGKAIDSSKGTFIREFGDHWLEQYGSMNTHLRCSRGTKGFYPGGEAGMLQSSKERTDMLNNILSTEGLSGGALWTGIDSNRGYLNNIAVCGTLDLYRIPKYSYYLFQSQLNSELRIQGIKSGPVVFIASFWTSDSARDITIYSNCRQVKLYLNGKILGVQEPSKEYQSLSNAPFVFKDIPWEMGELKAEGIVNGEVVAVHSVKTPETPHHLLLSVDSNGIGLIADGSDLLMVHAYIRDKNGTVIPEAYYRINFSISGPGDIVGDKDERVGSNPIEAEAGAIGVLIRARKEPGIITLKAEAKGLIAAVVEIESIACNKQFVPGKKQLLPCLKPIYEVDRIEIFSPPVAVEWEKYNNVAVSRPAKASSELLGCAAANAISFNQASRWSAANEELPQWWEVDLERFYDISCSKILWESDNTIYEYKIQASKDEVNWETMVSNRSTGNDSMPDRFNAKGTRYIRVMITRISKGLPSFYAFEAFGKELVTGPKQRR